MNFKEGQRVRLKPNAVEGWPEEFGKVIAEEDGNDMYVVRVDRKYWDFGDDGLREVSSDQMEEVS